MQKNKTFYKIFISYLLIFIVPMTLVGIVNYYKTLKIVQKNIEKDSMGVLNQAAYILDNRTKLINRLSDELSVNLKVKNFIYTKASDSREKVTLALDVINELLRYTVLNDSINDVYIYSKSNDTIISPTSLYPTEVFLKNFLKANDRNYNNWLELMGKPNFRSFSQGTFTQSNNTNSNKIVYINSIPSTNENFGNVMILLDEEKYSDIFSDVVNEDKGFYYVIDENNKVIISNDKQNRYSNYINIDSKSNSGVDHIKTPQGKAMMLYKYSTYNNWRYITFIPNEVFISEIISVKQSTLALIGIGIIIAFFMSLLAANKNYKNIKNIVNLIKGTYGTANYKGDDFNFIANILKYSYGEIKMNKELLNSQIPLIRQSYLSNILRESKNIDIKTLEKSKELLDIDLNFTYSTALIFKISQVNEISAENNEQQLYKFALSKTIEKYADEKNMGYTLEVDNNNIVLICGSNKEDIHEFQLDIVEFAMSIREQIECNFHIAVGVGNIYQGYRDLNNSYEEAIEAVDFAIFNNKSIVFFKQINKHGKIFNFPVQKEVQLINYIKNSKKQQALDIVRVLYKENYNNKEITYDMMRLFIYDLYCTIIKVLSEFNIDSTSITYKEINILEEQRLRTADISYILNSIEKIICVLCDFLEAQKKDSSSEFKEKILEYVDNNFLNNQISLEYIADNFNVTPQYLSKFFKEHIGVNYVEYVNSKRIERAKEYLVNNEIIKNAANKSGFENMGNFIKVFKKLVGVTPSEYKQNFFKDKSLTIKNGA